jgi:ABC-type transport system involved in multi-copper enzyme maturation permease subunit
MIQKNTRRLSFFLDSVKNVYSIFFSMGRTAKKTKIFFLFSFLPVVIAFIIKFNQIFSGRGKIQGIYIFSNLIVVFYLQFLILILALFFGTSVASEETEGQTLVYLTTRPIPKSAIVLGKYSAYTTLVILMMSVGVLLSFLILNVNNLGNFSLYKILLRDVVVLGLGLICYTAFFTFLGVFLKKSIIVGLVFSFGWENVIQYFPGSTQRFSIIHYLKSLLPTFSSGRFSFLMFRLEPSPTGTAIFMLFLITVIFLSLACILFSQKEYILED